MFALYCINKMLLYICNIYIYIMSAISVSHLATNLRNPAVHSDCGVRNSFGDVKLLTKCLALQCSFQGTNDHKHAMVHESVIVHSMSLQASCKSF